MLLPVACWAFSADIKGTQPAVSSMLFSFNTIKRPSKCLGRRMEAKLTETLGYQDTQQPMGQAAQAAVASLLAARPAAAQASDSYERGINHAMY